MPQTLKWTLHALTLALLGSHALADSFDLATFTVPSGYQKNAATQNVIRYIKQTSLSYCILDIYRSAQGNGNVNADFKQEWAEIIAKNLQAEEPETQPGSAKNGWQNLIGGAAYTLDGAPGVALLSTYSGFGSRLSVSLLTNNKACVNDLTSFLSSLTLKKPSGNTAGTTQTTSPTTSSVVTGFKFTTSNFDDGWVSTQFKDWVEVRKSNVTVRLHYGIPYTDQSRNLGDKTSEYFWNQVVQPRYPAQTLDTVNNSGYNSSYLAESDATERTSGKRVHVALLVKSNNGQAFLYEIITPDQATFKNMFPDDESIQKMQGYNRFNVAASDLTGTWEQSSSAGGTRYYAALGMITYAPNMSSSDRFAFNANGTYQYNWTGITGTVAQQEQYQGKFTVGHWVIATTDNKGKTTNYNASFEAVRGGRILHLQDQKATAMTYDLERTK